MLNPKNPKLDRRKEKLTLILASFAMPEKPSPNDRKLQEFLYNDMEFATILRSKVQDHRQVEQDESLVIGTMRFFFFFFFFFCCLFIFSIVLNHLLILFFFSLLAEWRIPRSLQRHLPRSP
jgi:hypothetical protein